MALDMAYSRARGTNCLNFEINYFRTAPPRFSATKEWQPPKSKDPARFLPILHVKWRFTMKPCYLKLPRPRAASAAET